MTKPAPNSPDRAQVALDAVMLPPMPPGYETWIYYDMRRGVQFNALEMQAWVDLLGGNNNIRTVALSKRLIEGVPHWRGQFFISPDGIARMLASQEWKAEAERASADAQAVASQRAANATREGQ